MMADRKAAIIQMDHAVRRNAINRLDKAVRAVEHNKVALWEAAAECQRTQAYEDDDDFKDALAAGTLSAVAESTYTTRFELWIGHRYGYKRTMAAQLAQAGQVYELLPENPPANERQMRPLYPLLKEEEREPGIVRRFWEAAREAAEIEHKPERVARHITLLIEQNDLKPRPTLIDDEKKLKEDIRRWRKLTASLIERLDTDQFNNLMDWLDHEMSNR